MWSQCLNWPYRYVLKPPDTYRANRPTTCSTALAHNAKRKQRPHRGPPVRKLGTDPASAKRRTCTAQLSVRFFLLESFFVGVVREKSRFKKKMLRTLALTVLVSSFLMYFMSHMPAPYNTLVRFELWDLVLLVVGQSEVFKPEFFTCRQVLKCLSTIFRCTPDNRMALRFLQVSNA